MQHTFSVLFDTERPMLKPCRYEALREGRRSDQPSALPCQQSRRVQRLHWKICSSGWSSNAATVMRKTVGPAHLVHVGDAVRAIGPSILAGARCLSVAVSQTSAAMTDNTAMLCTVPDNSPLSSIVRFRAMSRWVNPITLIRWNYRSPRKPGADGWETFCSCPERDRRSGGRRSSRKA
jgi:hypothetical protein